MRSHHLPLTNQNIKLLERTRGLWRLRFTWLCHVNTPFTLLIELYGEISSFISRCLRHLSPNPCYPLLHNAIPLTESSLPRLRGRGSVHASDGSGRCGAIIYV